MTFCDFSILNLQTLEALKQKSNPNQAHPKCKRNCCSSFSEKKLVQFFPLSLDYPPERFGANAVNNINKNTGMLCLHDLRVLI
jgi:hypothetical protein